MAARIRQNHQEDIRRKIQCSYLINRLEAHVKGEIELTTGQIQSAKILLDKSISNAPTQTEISGPDGEPLAHSMTIELVKSQGSAT